MPPPAYTSTVPISPRHLRKSKTINERRRGCCVQGGLGYSGSGVEILNPSQGEGGRLATLTQGWGLASLLLGDPSLGSHLFPSREEVRPPAHLHSSLCVPRISPNRAGGLAPCRRREGVGGHDSLPLCGLQGLGRPSDRSWVPADQV